MDDVHDELADAGESAGLAEDPATEVRGEPGDARSGAAPTQSSETVELAENAENAENATPSLADDVALTGELEADLAAVEAELAALEPSG